MEDDESLHPIELIAHSVLNSSLDNLNENFESLHNSQVVLLTRLKLIEQRLSKVSITNKDTHIQQDLIRIKSIRKRLQVTQKTLDKIDRRVEMMNGKLSI